MSATYLQKVQKNVTVCMWVSVNVCECVSVCVSVHHSCTLQMLTWQCV